MVGGRAVHLALEAEGEDRRVDVREALRIRAPALQNLCSHLRPLLAWQ